jgi:hypothetical protein
MTESPYAIPEEDLLNNARVPVVEQIIEQPERRFFGGDWAGGTILGWDGGGCDAGGE